MIKSMGNEKIGYILRRYNIIHENGNVEQFRYYNKDKYFPPGIESYISLLRKSVFISGFCFRRDYVIDFYDTNDFNGTLLYQLFLCGSIMMTHESAYCDILITKMTQIDRGIPEFGSSINEKNNYTPGIISIENSVNFMKSFLKITNYFDKKFNIQSTKLFVKDLSKYSYPVLSIQRSAGIKNFNRYVNILIKEIKINKSFYFYIYYFSLILLGEKSCNKIIIFIKNLIGRTPNL